MAATKTAARDVASEIAYLTRALKAPTLRESVARLAERARSESWTHEQFLLACLQREVAARESHGGEGRIRAARFPARKSLEEFDYDHSRGLKGSSPTWARWTSSPPKRTWCSSAHPAPARRIWRSGWASGPARHGHRVLFATASEWVARLADAHGRGHLQAELVRLGRYRC
jgi:DNA replication protein DnaC